MYRVYLIKKTSHGSEVVQNSKTTTSSPEIARQAFLELIQRNDLVGQKIGAMLSLNGKQLMFHRFDYQPGMTDYVHPTDTIRLYHD